jgi:hypothetical protein
VELYLNSPNTPLWHGAQLKHRVNFTFALVQLRKCNKLYFHEHLGLSCWPVRIVRIHTVRSNFLSVAESVTPSDLEFVLVHQLRDSFFCHFFPNVFYLIMHHIGIKHYSNELICLSHT